jgi:predicted nucleotide-binding protein
MNALAEKIEELIGLAFDGGFDESSYEQWRRRVSKFLALAFNNETAQSFDSISEEFWTDKRAAQVGMLEGLVQQILVGYAAFPSRPGSSEAIAALQPSKKVFIVHGHDTEAKESVARFIGLLGLEPIILHEQPSSGRTIIEKFEVFADVGFAVVLLTPDDFGGAADLATDIKKRARQNVVFELGYFVGKLKRSRVCALYKPDVEIPSDFQGVVYVELDPKGAWKTRLAQELSDAALPIKLEALLKS